MNRIPTPAYDELTDRFSRMHRLGHLQSIASWDQAANMPPGGIHARAAAIGEITSLLHQMRTDPALGRRITEAEQEPLSDLQRANLREIRRGWTSATALPARHTWCARVSTRTSAKRNSSGTDSSTPSPRPGPPPW